MIGVSFDPVSVAVNSVSSPATTGSPASTVRVVGALLIVNSAVPDDGASPLPVNDAVTT